MSFPARTNAGIVNLGDPKTRLHYVNCAHRVLVTHCDRNGWLSLSSSESLLRRYLEDLTDAQVAEVNRVLFALGLRESKPGGSDHVIRIDIREITLEQLLANQRLPAATFADVAFGEVEDGNDALVEAVELVIEGLKEGAELVSGSPYRVAIVRNHMAIIADMAGELASDVIMVLKRLDLYRVYAFGDDHLCFIQPGVHVLLAPDVIAQGRAQLEWPDTVEELLPPNYLVTMMSPEQLVTALVRQCERLSEECQQERRARVQAECALSALGDKLSEVVGAYERLKATHEASLADLDVATSCVADLEAKLAALQARSATDISEELLDRVARILDDGEA